MVDLLVMYGYLTASILLCIVKHTIIVEQAWRLPKDTCWGRDGGQQIGPKPVSLPSGFPPRAVLHTTARIIFIGSDLIKPLCWQDSDSWCYASQFGFSLTFQPQLQVTSPGFSYTGILTALKTIIASNYWAPSVSQQGKLLHMTYLLS